MGARNAATSLERRVPARIALISPPWHLANRPCLAISVLKGYARRHGIAIDACHMHLAVAARLGWDSYSSIAMHWELSEALYSALVAPEEAAGILERTALRLEATGQDGLARFATQAFCAELARITRESIANFNLARYDVAGFSASHLQLMSSLYIARILREQAPGITIVFGGRGVCGEAGRQILARVDQVDVAVDGEGEEALLALAHLCPPFKAQDLRAIPNLWFRSEEGTIERTQRRLIANLEELAPPDCDEYFGSAEGLGIPRAGLALPLEASRGCAWEHRSGDGRLLGCAFCSLNRNWPTYREKPVRRVIEEIREGVERYRVLDLSFADACLPESYRKELLRGLIALGKDLTIFCELRAGFDEETAQLLALACVRKVQIGVESFSTGLLKRLGKGLAAIDNVSAIKLCHEYGVPYQYNLLTHVPGVEAREIEEMLQVLPLLYGFEPPHLVPLYVGRGSRMHRSPEEFGIAAESLDERPCGFLPAFLARAGVADEVPCRAAPPALPDSEWRRVFAAVGAWREARKRAGAHCPLTYRDGGDFVAIEDSRGDPARCFTLEGTARDVFLAAGRLTSLFRLRELCAHLGAQEFTDIVDSLESEGLLLREGSLVLALPVHKPAPSGSPRTKGHADLRTVSLHQ